MDFQTCRVSPLVRLAHRQLETRSTLTAKMSARPTTGCLHQCAIEGGFLAAVLGSVRAAPPLVRTTSILVSSSGRQRMNHCLRRPHLWMTRRTSPFCSTQGATGTMSFGPRLGGAWTGSRHHLSQCRARSGTGWLGLAALPCGSGNWKPSIPPRWSTAASSSLATAPTRWPSARSSGTIQARKRLNAGCKSSWTRKQLMRSRSRTEIGGEQATHTCSSLGPF
mmetsp:Transcript_22115/g.64175  ORF Transcript_22115/g.64175 Transcript_22115/m.64175 type:complete len:222 (+) Transcript_22115:214-879(+)